MIPPLYNPLVKYKIKSYCCYICFKSKLSNKCSKQSKITFIFQLYNYTLTNNYSTFSKTIFEVSIEFIKSLLSIMIMTLFLKEPLYLSHFKVVHAFWGIA